MVFLGNSYSVMAIKFAFFKVGIKAGTANVAFSPIFPKGSAARMRIFASLSFQAEIGIWGLISIIPHHPTQGEAFGYKNLGKDKGDPQMLHSYLLFISIPHSPFPIPHSPFPI